MRVTQKGEGAFEHLYYEQVVFKLLFKSILIIRTEGWLEFYYSITKNNFTRILILLK